MQVVTYECRKCEHPLTLREPDKPTKCCICGNTTFEAVSCEEITMPNVKKYLRDKFNDGTASAQKHYQVADIQPIEIMQMYLSQEEFQGFLRANIIKYTLRLGHKDDNSREIDKIYQYAKWLRQAVRGEKINPKEEG